MKMKKRIGFLLALAMAVSLAACGVEREKPETTNPERTIDKMQAQIDEQFEALNGILEEQEPLWNRLLEQEDDMTSKTSDDSIVSSYLTALLEDHKDLLSDAEYQTLYADIERIIAIEKELYELEDAYAKMLEESGMSQENPTAKTFPAFKGTDLDGNEVDSAALFAGNKVTVVNFWFSSCSPCVGELSELNDLNEQLKEKGGAVIGINVDTLDGNQVMIDEAKKILEQKGATYRNVQFASDSEAGRFAGQIIGFPTTYVVDSNGNIMGEPLMGAINYSGMMELLQAQISAALGETGTPDESAPG